MLCIVLQTQELKRQTASVTRQSGDIRTRTVNRSAKFNDNTTCAIEIKFAIRNGNLKF